MKILVTGCAGFIGSATSLRLLELGYSVIGIDNLNNYYDPTLKSKRLDKILSHKNFKFYKINIEDKNSLQEIFNEHSFNLVLHLAAQVGVRNSIKNPEAYIQTNVVGFLNILEACKNFSCKNLIYASSSSVYGNQLETPFKTTQNTDEPISLYAATKKTNELMAHAYSQLYSINTIGLRFFTVYGPWGRPDMAVFSFTENILNGNPIQVYSEGKHSRDMTYIDDVVKSLELLILKETSQKKAQNNFQIFNIGNEKPIQLLDLIQLIENNLDKKANMVLTTGSPGDVKDTLADSSELYHYIHYKPQTETRVGIQKFVEWYKDFYNK